MPTGPEDPNGKNNSPGVMDPPGALTRYEGKKEEDIVDEDIDERILKLLGLDGVYDIDYGTYFSLLRERLIESRAFGKPLTEEEDQILRDELKRVKGKVGRFKLKVKKINASSFLSKNVGRGAASGGISIDDKKYFISGSAVAPLPALPAAKDSISESLLDIVKSIRETVDSIYATLQEQSKQSQKTFEINRRERENQARAKKEEGLEKKKTPSILKAADKLIAPAKGLLAKIFDFIIGILLGRAFGAFMDWASDPKNAKKVASLARFIKDWWPALLAAWFFFANPLGKFIRSIVGSIAKLTFTLLKPALKSLTKAAMKNPKAAAVIAGGAALATAGAWVPAMFPETVNEQERKTAEASKTPEGKKNTENELQRKAQNPNIWERITGQDAEAKEQLEFQKTGKTKSYGFSSGGDVSQVTSKTGKKVTGAGRDTQLVDVVDNEGQKQGNAVIKVGEVVLNEQQQAKIAADHGVNVKDYVKNAKPKAISSEKLGLSGGGVVKYETGGVVGQSRADTRSTAPSSGSTRLTDVDRKKTPDENNKGNSAILGAAKKAVTEGKRGPATPPCASWVRMVLGMAGHPSAEKTTKTADLDVEKGYTGRNFAGSFAGSDMGQVIRNSSGLQGGDIVLQKNTYGSYPAGAITHVSIASDKAGSILHQSTSGGAPKESGLFNFAYGVRLPGSGVTGGTSDAAGGGGTGGGGGTAGTGGGASGGGQTQTQYDPNSLLGRIAKIFGADQQASGGGTDGSGATTSSPAAGGGGGGNANIQLGSTEYKALMIETMNKGGITDKNERIMFMAQVGHESGEGRYLEEIASGSAYEGRSDLGNNQPGDGKKFKGRGYIQITGRANYAKYGPKVGVPDATENPKKLAEPKTAAKVALAYWLDRVDRNAAKKGMAGMNTVTRNINGGLNGLDDRIAKFKKYESDSSIHTAKASASGGGLLSSYVDGGLIGLAKGGGVGAPSGGGSPGDKAMNFLISSGLTKEQAAGIAGNLQQESGFNPSASNGSHYGIAQWDKQNRWPKVSAYIKSQGKDPNSLEGQLAGLKWEAEQRGDWAKIKSESSATGAAASWLKNFERSGEKPGQGGYENRMKYAKQLAGGSYSGTSVSSSEATEKGEEGKGTGAAASSGSTDAATQTAAAPADDSLLGRIKALFGMGDTSSSAGGAAASTDGSTPAATGDSPEKTSPDSLAPGDGKAAGSAQQGSKIAGEAGRYIKSKLKSPQQFQAVTEHPEHGGVRGRHAPNSYHYTKPGRAIDIGAYAHEQGPILKVISDFNKEKKVKPVELLKAGDPGHSDHVHVAYNTGGLVSSAFNPSINLNPKSQTQNTFNPFTSNLGLNISPLQNNYTFGQTSNTSSAFSSNLSLNPKSQSIINTLSSSKSGKMELSPMEQWAQANRKMIEKVGTKKQKEILKQLDEKIKSSTESKVSTSNLAQVTNNTSTAFNPNVNLNPQSQSQNTFNPFTSNLGLNIKPLQNNYTFGQTSNNVSTAFNPNVSLGADQNKTQSISESLKELREMRAKSLDRQGSSLDALTLRASNYDIPKFDTSNLKIDPKITFGGGYDFGKLTSASTGGKIGKVYGASGGGGIGNISKENVEKITTNTGHDITTAGADTQKTTVDDGSFVLTKKTTSSLEKGGEINLKNKSSMESATGGGSVKHTVALQPGETLVKPQGVAQAGGSDALAALNEAHDPSATNKPRMTSTPSASSGGKIKVKKAYTGGSITNKIDPFKSNVNLMPNLTSPKEKFLPFSTDQVLSPKAFDITQGFQSIFGGGDKQTIPGKVEEIDTTCTCVPLEDVLNKLKKTETVSEPPGPPVNKNSKPNVVTLPEVTSPSNPSSSMPASGGNQIPLFPVYANASLEIRSLILQEFEVIY